MWFNNLQYVKLVVLRLHFHSHSSLLNNTFVILQLSIQDNFTSIPWISHRSWVRLFSIFTRDGMEILSLSQPVNFCWFFYLDDFCNTFCTFWNFSEELIELKFEWKVPIVVTYSIWLYCWYVDDDHMYRNRKHTFIKAENILCVPKNHFMPNRSITHSIKANHSTSHILLFALFSYLSE